LSGNLVIFLLSFELAGDFLGEDTGDAKNAKCKTRIVYFDLEQG